MTKIAVVLSGSGVYDGAEIHEAVLTLLHLDTRGVQYQCFAPNIPQLHVVNHLTGEVAANESRNVLVEAARIARGNIKDLKQARVEDFDALVVPGGFGAAKNLCDFAINGTNCKVQPDFLNFARAMHKAGKPIALICIAPVMSALICGDGTECTIGNDAETAAAIKTLGGKHIDCSVRSCHVDREKKLVTTPAYMLASRISEAAEGIGTAIHELISLTKK